MQRNRNGTKVAQEAAVGIPSREVYGDPTLSLLPGELYDLIVQKHLAERAGEHRDIRIGSPTHGLFSWSTKKEPYFPLPGEKRFLKQQPLHAYWYKDFEGNIRTGYGKGDVKKELEGKILVTKVTPQSVHFTLAHTRYPERFVLIKPQSEKWGEKSWLLINTTPIKPLPYQKIRFKKIPAEKVEEALQKLDPGSSVQAKIDGAHSLISIAEDNIEILSYRTSKVTGGPIIHTERVYGTRPQLEVPPKYVGTILRAELYGKEKSGKVIPPQELGGILNSSIAKALQDKKKKGISLHAAVFDIQQYGKDPILFNLPYRKRRQLMEEVVDWLNREGLTNIHVTEEALSPQEARELWEIIKQKKHPLTHEGIVIHPSTGKPIKAKILEDVDVYIRGFFEGKGKYEGKGVGGFYYSLTPDGEIVGKVGTGLSDQLRMDMYQHPEDYIGRVARIRTQEQYSDTGAYRAPALIALHEDYPTKQVEE